MGKLWNAGNNCTFYVCHEGGGIGQVGWTYQEKYTYKMLFLIKLGLNHGWNHIFSWKYDCVSFTVFAVSFTVLGLHCVSFTVLKLHINK